MKRLVLAAFCAVCLALMFGHAQAQNSLSVGGALTGGHLLMSFGGRALDAGGSTVANGPPLNSVLPGTRPTGLAIVNGGLGDCQFSAYANAPHSALCTGFDGSGNALFTLDSLNGQPLGSFKLRLNGAIFPFPGAVTGMPTIADNATLLLTPTTFAATLTREDFAPGRGAPAVVYRASGSPCSLNGGNGDNGSQSKSSDNKCWLAALGGIKPTPMIWGAAGDGVTDDSAAVQAAINALQNATLYTGPHLYKLNSGVSSAGKIAIVGEYGNDNTTSKGGFRAGAQNLNLITLNGGDSLARDLYIDMGNAGTITNTSGSAFFANAGANSAFLHNTIMQPCGAFDVSGAGWVLIEHNETLGAKGAGCNIVRVGHTSTGATTVDTHIIGNTWNVEQGNPPATCARIEDSGAMHYQWNECVYAAIGVQIIPGANQYAIFGLYNGVLGDTDSNVGLYIDTAANTGVVRGNEFSETWASSAINSCVLMRNAGLGIVSGNHFRGHRSYNCGLHGFDIAGADWTSITDSNICSNSQSGINAGSGVVVGANVARVTLRGNTIANGCDGQTGGGQAYGALFLGTNATIQIVGNYLSGNNLAPYNIANPLSGSSRVSDNVGLNPIGTASVTPGASPWTLSASATPTTYYFTGGAVSSITQGGLTLATASPAQIHLGPNESVVVTYTVAPTVVQSAH